MKFRNHITALLLAGAALVVTACQELPGTLLGGTTLARAGKRELHVKDVQSVVPKGVTGEDSVAFMNRYIDRWVRKQLMLQEAEELFSSSEADIDRMVEEYRQALLIRRLEQHYVDNAVDTTFTEQQIEAYYNEHRSDFRLDEPVVKGRIVRFRDDFRQARKLKELMASPAEAKQQDFYDICAKNDLTLTDFTASWVEYAEFLGYLPTNRSEEYEQLLSSTAVQEMRDSRSHYYFQIQQVRRAGESIPLDRLRPTIRRILFNQRQREVIRNHEEELFTRSVAEGDVKIHGRNVAAEMQTEATAAPTTEEEK